MWSHEAGNLSRGPRVQDRAQTEASALGYSHIMPDTEYILSIYCQT